MSEPAEADQTPGAPSPRATFSYFGHAEAEVQMDEVRAAGRMHHAWLVTGPRGVGKATLAYRFARRVLGAARTGPRPFDVAPDDPVARRISAMGHGDLFVLRRAHGERGRLRREIRAEEARALATFFTLAPAEGGWRVAIIDSVDDLNRHAANAILKILEEPPAKCVLLLVCHAPGAALSTIRSRCRRIALRPTSDEDCAAAVRAALGAEPDPRALALAKGRPGRAVALQALGAPVLAEAIDEAMTRLGRTGAAAFAPLAFDRAGDAHDRADLFFDLLLDRIASSAAAAGRGAAVAGPIDAASTARWAGAWSDLSDLRAQLDGLGMDPAHAILRAGQILAQAGAAP